MKTAHVHCCRSLFAVVLFFQSNAFASYDRCLSSLLSALAKQQLDVQGKAYRHPTVLPPVSAIDSKDYVGGRAWLAPSGEQVVNAFDPFGQAKFHRWRTDTRRLLTSTSFPPAWTRHKDGELLRQVNFHAGSEFITAHLNDPNSTERCGDVHFYNLGEMESEAPDECVVLSRSVAPKWSAVRNAVVFRDGQVILGPTEKEQLIDFNLGTLESKVFKDVPYCSSCMSTDGYASMDGDLLVGGVNLLAYYGRIDNSDPSLFILNRHDGSIISSHLFSGEKPRHPNENFSNREAMGFSPNDAFFWFIHETTLHLFDTKKKEWFQLNTSSSWNIRFLKFDARAAEVLVVSNATFYAPERHAGSVETFDLNRRRSISNGEIELTELTSHFNPIYVALRSENGTWDFAFLSHSGTRLNLAQLSSSEGLRTIHQFKDLDPIRGLQLSENGQALLASHDTLDVVYGSNRAGAPGLTAEVNHTLFHPEPPDNDDESNEEANTPTEHLVLN